MDHGLMSSSHRLARPCQPHGAVMFHRSECARPAARSHRAKYIIEAFGKAGYPPDEWVEELTHMKADGSLGPFMDAVGPADLLTRAHNLTAFPEQMNWQSARLASSLG